MKLFNNSNEDILKKEILQQRIDQLSNQCAKRGFVGNLSITEVERLQRMVYCLQVVTIFQAISQVAIF